LEKHAEYEIIRNNKGIVTKALKRGDRGRHEDVYGSIPRLSRHQAGGFPRRQKRLVAAIPSVTRPIWTAPHHNLETTHMPFGAGRELRRHGFYWRAREIHGHRGAFLRLVRYPKLMHEMMEFYADLIIETVASAGKESSRILYSQRGYVHEGRPAAQPGDVP
jgi:hypothetical protein